MSPHLRQAIERAIALSTRVLDRSILAYSERRDYATGIQSHKDLGRLLGQLEVYSMLVERDELLSLLVAIQQTHPRVWDELLAHPEFLTVKAKAPTQ